MSAESLTGIVSALLGTHVLGLNSSLTTKSSTVVYFILIVVKNVDITCL